jgi:hypothetical protein
MFDTNKIPGMVAELKVIAEGLKKLPEVIPAKTGEILTNSAVRLRNDILRTLRNTPKADYFYKRGKKRHYPSKPGNAPAIDRGNMAGSIVFDASPYKMQVGTVLADPAYPKFLEDGTPDIKPRPWLEPAVEKELPALYGELNEVLPEAIDVIFSKT